MLPEPLPAQFPFWNGGKGKPILILGFLPGNTVVYVDAEGQLGFTDEDTVVTDWRYNAEADDWMDVSLIPTEPIAPEEA